MIDMAMVWFLRGIFVKMGGFFKLSLLVDDSLKGMKMLKKAVVLAMLLLPVAAQAADRRVVVENRSSSNICEIYGSNVSRDSWEEDILGNDILPAGDRVRINFNDGSGACRFDLKAVTCDGREIINRNVNICRISTWTIRN